MAVHSAFPPARSCQPIQAGCSVPERSEAAKIGGVGLQIIRDWVLRFNARGPNGLLDGKGPGEIPKRSTTIKVWLVSGSRVGIIGIIGQIKAYSVLQKPRSGFFR